MARTLKDCPVTGCRSQQLKKLSNHLKQTHGFNRMDRQKWLEKANQMSSKEFPLVKAQKQAPVSAALWSPHNDNTRLTNWWASECLLPFNSCSSIMVTGGSGSGKTTWINVLFQNLEKMCVPTTPEAVLYCYSVYQPLFDEMKKSLPNIMFHEGLPSQEDIERFANGRHRLIVIDDLMHSVGSNTNIELLFTQGCHHRKLSVIYITQNLYQQGKTSRTIALNTQYLVLFRNFRDASQVSFLGRQLYPRQSSMFVDVYKDCTAEPYSYLVIDMAPNSNDLYRLRTRIMPGDDPIVYIPGV